MDLDDQFAAGVSKVKGITGKFTAAKKGTSEKRWPFLEAKLVVQCCLGLRVMHI